MFAYCYREARQISLSKNIEDAISNFGSIQLLKCNCNGTKVAFVSQNVTTFLFFVIGLLLYVSN